MASSTNMQETAPAALGVILNSRAVSGKGQFHTANPKSKNSKPYIDLPWVDILSMVQNPGSIPKEKAQWCIFSTIGGELGRVHQYQRDHGQFFCAWADLDDVNDLTMRGVTSQVKTALPGIYHIVYSSRSARADIPKSRVLIPFSVIVPGADYSMIQKILNDRLGAAGLPPDRASERPGQLCYLPNQGEFYQFNINNGPLLDPYAAFKSEIEAEQARLKKEQEDRSRRHREAIQKAQQRVNTGQVDPIEAFRQNYPVELALENYGYTRRAGKYLSPLSESGNPGVKTKDGKWYSHHSNDADIGQPGPSGGTWGDAFDLFVHFECGGDFKRAIQAAGEMFTTVDPVTGQTVSITKANQRGYMRNQDTTGIDPKTEDPKAPEQSPDPTGKDKYIAAILEKNTRHACIMIGGKFLILNKYIDPLTGRPEISFSTVFDFKSRYANKQIIKIVPDGNGGEKKKLVPIADEWLKHPLRREYEGIVFDPSEKVPSEYYNLWTGFEYSPKKGDWNLLESHILDVIAAGDYEIYTWILAWMSRIVQDPGGKRPGTSIVLRGKQRTGKGLFVNFFGQLFGKHFNQIAHASQVTGRFNSHFKDALLVFVDEGFWAGDKQAEGILKNLVTEPFITVEQKGKDIIRVKNHVNLIMASNNDWVIPAGLEERRFFVLDVSDKHRQDHKYFKAIVDQMENGGVEAMLHDLLAMDISQVNLRKFKQTAGLFEQKLYSMNTIQKFWFERLKEGSLIPINPEEPEQYGAVGWGEICKTKFYDNYLTFAGCLKDRFPLSPQQFGISLKKVCREVGEARPNVNGRRIRVYRFPPLEDCRNEFNQSVGIEVNWDDD